MGATHISKAVRNIIAKPFFLRLRSVSQWGEPLNFLFLGKLPCYTVFDHTWLFYEFADYFAQKENLSVDDTETLRVAAIIHDGLKPAWSPLSEPFMEKSHESLLRELTELRDEKTVRWDDVFDAVEGQGRFGNCFEGEGDLDKLSYTALANELLMTTYEDYAKPEHGFGIKEAKRLIHSYKLVSKNGKSLIALEPDPIAISLFSQFLASIVEHYKLFLSPYVSICEGLGFRALEDAIESRRLDIRWFNDVDWITRISDRDVDTVFYNLKPDTVAAAHAKKLWDVIRNRRFALYNCVEIPYQKVVGEFIGKLREFRKTKVAYMNSKFRFLLKNAEEWTARKVGATVKEERDFILLNYERIKPDFTTTYDMRDYSWSMKLKIDGLDLLSKNEDIKKIKEEAMNQLNRLVLIFPMKYSKKIKTVPWEEIPVEL